MLDVKASLIEIKSELKHMPKAGDLTALRSDFASLKADVARIDGRISQLPTSWTMFMAIVTTWSAGAAIVFTVLRYARP